MNLEIQEWINCFFDELAQFLQFFCLDVFYVFVVRLKFDLFNQLCRRSEFCIAVFAFVSCFLSFFCYIVAKLHDIRRTAEPAGKSKRLCFSKLAGAVFSNTFKLLLLLYSIGRVFHSERLYQLQGWPSKLALQFTFTIHILYMLLV